MGLRVIIVGAGIAGLCVAIALRRVGLDVEVRLRQAATTTTTTKTQIFLPSSGRLSTYG